MIDLLNNKDIGNFGEDIAVSYLLKQGYILLARNYRTRTGEIDIILRKDDTLCFVEVKTRYNNKFGSPAECVGQKKRVSIIKTSLRYIAAERLYKLNARFDVVEILLNYTDDSYLINHLAGAF